MLTRWRDESRLIRHYLWKYRRAVAYGLAMLVTVDLLEIVPPLILMATVDGLIAGKPMAFAFQCAAAYLAVSLVQAACRYFWRFFLVRTSMRSGRDLRVAFAQHLFGLPASYYDRTRIGDLMSHASSDVEAVRMVVGAGLIVFADALFYFFTVPVAMFWLSPRLTALAFLPLPLIPLIVLRNERAIHARFTRLQEQGSRLAAVAQESLSGIRTVKAFAQEARQGARMRALSEEWARLSLSLARVQVAFGPILDFTMSLGLVILLYVGSGWVMEGAVTIGTFVAFQRYIQKMVWPMAAIGLAVSFYKKGVASGARVEKVLAEKTDVPAPAEPVLPAAAAPTESALAHVASWRTPGGIEYRDFTFAYPQASRAAVRGFNARIEPGARVGFVGPVGGGKSTVLSALPRVYPAARGSVSVDGVDVNDWPIHELRRQIGYVSQDAFLFSESVLENIAFGLLDREAGLGAESGALAREFCEGAARHAAVHDDVLGLSSGYATRVGERGVNLSGGQRQRLTIARALAKEPAILVLDDALASVDTRTEAAILRGLRARGRRNTELVAAHRATTLADADCIHVLVAGECLQQGTHAQLLRDRAGYYFRWYERQRLKEELEDYVRHLET